MADLKLPVFGKPSAESGFESLFGNLQTEMLWCTRDPPEDSSVDVVNILHVSADTSPAEAEVAQMADFMKTKGFAVRREAGPADWARANVLVMGVDDKPPSDQRVILDGLVRQAGLIQDLDVLLYGVGSEVDLMLGAPDKPLRTGRTFGFDGACLLHAHIRMRDNQQFWAGYLAHMTDKFGHLIASTILILLLVLHGKDDRPKLTLDKKINRLVRVLGEAGLDGPDVELFRCAANIIRKERNRYAHMEGDLNPPGWLSFDNHYDYDLWEGFFRIAERYGRLDLLAGVDESEVDNGQGRTLFLTRLILTTHHWLLDCHKMAKIKSGGIITGPNRPARVESG